MKQSILVLGCFVFFTKQAITQSSFSDTRDDNFYGTVQIGKANTLGYVAMNKNLSEIKKKITYLLTSLII